jgi:hypothetical protein
MINDRYSPLRTGHLFSSLKNQYLTSLLHYILILPSTVSFGRITWNVSTVLLTSTI